MALKPARLQWSDDGSVRSLDFGDIYFQGTGREESDYVFLRGNGLPGRFQGCDGVFRVAELGFGTGLNFLLTAALFLEKAPLDARLFYVTLEKHPIEKPDLAKIHARWPDLAPLSQEILKQYPPLMAGFHTLLLAEGRIQLLLAFGDAAETLPQLTGNFDAWYLDGFSPAKNPEMWQEKLYPTIAALTAPGGTLASFSAAGDVRRGLEASGFTVEKTKGFGVKRDMTVAQKSGDRPEAAARKDIAVLGAGIAGCAAAAALARRGHRITLIDRQNTSAQETSGNPAAVLYPKITADPSPLGDFHQHAFCQARGLLRHLDVKSWQEMGVLHLGIDDESKKRHRDIARSNRFTEDFARADEKDGLFHASGGHLSPPEFCRALIRRKDIQKKFNNHVWQLERAGDKWHVRGEEDDELLAEADIVVLALGYDTAAFDDTEWLPVQTVRGQITFLREKPDAPPLAHVVCHDGYITPAIGGLHFIGATFQKEEPETTDLREGDHLENLEKLSKHMPELGFTAEDIAGGRAGYRATTPDRLPLIGPCPDYKKTVETFSGLRQGADVEGAKMPYLEGLYISAAFGAHGMSGAPFAGEIIAAIIEGDPLPLPRDLLPYVLPERFILRDLKRKKI